jgi:23S rRNA (uracil1939-C5)-methyltransferase
MDRRNAPVPVERDEIVVGRCVAPGEGPDGVVKVDDYVVFVPGVLKGEEVRFKVTSAARKHGRGDLLEVLSTSPHRVEPRCAHFLDCGGCNLQHQEYRRQLQQKAERVRRVLARALGHEDVPVQPCIGPDDPWGHRSKVAFHIGWDDDGQPVAGHLAARSVRIVPVEECPVADPEAFAAAMEAVDAAFAAGIEPWDPDTDEGELRAVLVRAAKSTGQLHLTLVLRRARRPVVSKVARDLVEERAVRGVSVSFNSGPFSRLLGDHVDRVAGERDLEEDVHGVRFRISGGAFFQTSYYGAETIARLVREMIDAPSNAVIHDLYAGVGLLGLTLAPHVGRVVCVEENEVAAGDCEVNAERNKLTNVVVKQGAVGKVLGFLARGQLPPHAVVLDPPRTGCGPNILERLARDVAPRKICYVSCDPQSLADDAEFLSRRGYRLVKVQPVDMFAHAHHVESVALFEATTNLDPARKRLYTKAARRLAGRRRDASRAPEQVD